MGFHTPIDKHYKFGELFGIRGSYLSMNDNIEAKNKENAFYNAMISYIVESGNMEKIERFARKNRKLSEFTQRNALHEAFKNAELSTSSLDIPKMVKNRASKKAEIAVSKKALSIKTNSYNLPSFAKIEKEPTIYEALEDYIETDNDENIDKLIRDVAKEKGIIGNAKVKMEDDVEDEKNDIIDSIRHNYSIQSVIVEAIAGNDKKTELIQPTSIFEENTNSEKNFLNSTIKNVTDGINAICGINFTENDYIWLASGRPVPHFKGELAVTSEIVKGNRLLNAYFGPAGTYKDYLFKADGTPRIELSKTSSMDEIDVETNAIQSYPIIKVYATVISWDNVNGKDTIREIQKEDFTGTSIKFIE